jgi:hypothetical protein
MNDLFETPELIPEPIQDILDTFEDNTYEECERVLNLIKPLGYTFEYYLDAVPFNLTKIIN